MHQPSHLIEAYLAFLTLTGYREGTLRTRRSVLRQLDAYLAPRMIAEATRHDLQAFLARPLAAESRRSYRSHLRSFYAWLAEEGLISADPSLKLPPIRVRRGVPRPIGGDDLIRAITSADQRMRAWLLLMALAGLRCIEVAALEPQDLIHNDSGWLLRLRVTKGGVGAVVPAHDAVVASLQGLRILDGNLWWSTTRHYVSQATSHHLHSVGVQATAHQLRHFAGTAWYRSSGHDLLTTAALLRHASVRTTQVYAQLDPVRPAEVVASVRLAEAS